MDQPTLETERLVLRPFVADDARRVEELAGDPAIAATTLSIPHPYPPGAAALWIGTHTEAFREDKSVVFAITLKHSGSLVGAMGLDIQRRHDRAEIGYWIGQPHWNKGYATEALRAVLLYGFRTLKLHRIQACHFVGNPASGRVMQKAGMHEEGVLRGRVKKNGQHLDISLYARLATDAD